MSMDHYIAATRFGLGVARGQTAVSNPKRDLLGQLDRLQSTPARGASETIIAEYLAFQADARSAAQMGEIVPPEKRALMAQNFRQGIDDRLQQAVETTAPFAERLVHFWSNHFAIDAKPLILRSLMRDYEAVAIRPHINGRFSDLLQSALLHPAMLIYLDQVNSIGPNSIAGQRGVKARDLAGRKAGLNENLAREILELHTLGVNGGYTQNDVEELARAMTGHTVAHYSRRRDAMEGSRNAPIGRTLFIPALHEAGERRLLGQSYADTGARQFMQMLEALSLQPATARFLATKLARHFVADTPPPSLVDAMQSANLKSGGQLSALYSAMLQSPESWRAQPQKFKSPWDWTVSAFRLLGGQAAERVNALKFVQDLGQAVWQPGSPAGFGDSFTHWASPDALMRRVTAAEKLGLRARRNGLTAAELEAAFPTAMLSETSRNALIGAESPQMQWAVALSLPEFQRR